jgi:predicted RNase H-like HicB family nuclease
VAETPAIGGCYALMDTREAALAEIGQVFDLIALEHRERGRRLPTAPIEIRQDSRTASSLRAPPRTGSHKS